MTFVPKSGRNIPYNSFALPKPVEGFYSEYLEQDVTEGVQQEGLIDLAVAFAHTQFNINLGDFEHNLAHSWMTPPSATAWGVPVQEVVRSALGCAQRRGDNNKIQLFRRAQKQTCSPQEIDRRLSLERNLQLVQPRTLIELSAQQTSFVPILQARKNLSSEALRYRAAVHIQKFVRGYLVRKKIPDIRAEVAKQKKAETDLLRDVSNLFEREEIRQERRRAREEVSDLAVGVSNLFEREKVQQERRRAREEGRCEKAVDGVSGLFEAAEQALRTSRAVTRIQAALRGYLARQELAELKAQREMEFFQARCTERNSELDIVRAQGCAKQGRAAWERRVEVHRARRCARDGADDFFKGISKFFEEAELQARSGARPFQRMTSVGHERSPTREITSSASALEDKGASNFKQSTSDNPISGSGSASGTEVSSHTSFEEERKTDLPSFVNESFQQTDSKNPSSTPEPESVSPESRRTFTALPSRQQLDAVKDRLASAHPVAQGTRGGGVIIGTDCMRKRDFLSRIKALLKK